MVKVAVVGAGIIGLSSAIAIQQKLPGIDITLLADKFSPDTTGDGAAGLWEPYFLGDTDPKLITTWSGITYNFIRKLWSSPEGGIMGVSLIPNYIVYSDPNAQPPEWKDAVLGFREMSAEEVRRSNKPNGKKGFTFTTFVCEPSKLLPHFLRQFEKAGGKRVHGRVTNLKCLRDQGFDIVVHCTGVQAQNFVQDKAVQAIRGQVMRIEAPGIFHSIIDMDDDGNYIIPNQDSVVLGGTHQENDWNLNVCPIDKKAIKDGCSKLNPSVKNSKILFDWVGLRPGRTSVCLEVETLKFPGEAKPLTVIHNYGHGGSGVTLFWGCALDASAMVAEHVRRSGQFQISLPQLNSLSLSKL